MAETEATSNADCVGEKSKGQDHQNFPRLHLSAELDNMVDSCANGAYELVPSKRRGGGGGGGVEA